MAIEDFFNSTVDLEQPTETVDDVMGRVRTWAAVHSGLHCCIQPRQGREFDKWLRDVQSTTHVMYCRVADVSSSLPEEDWRCIASAHPTDGRYNIRAVRNIDELDRFLTIAMDLIR